MNSIEIIVVAIAAILTLPHLCRLIKRPALLYCAYLLLGVVIGEFIRPDTRFMLDEIGKVGFILLLFLVGLEIDLPSFNALRQSFRFCLIWLGIQIPLFVALSMYWNLGEMAGLIMGTGLNACSLGITHCLLEGQKGIIAEASKNKLLTTMIMLEVFAVFTLSLSEVVYSRGWSMATLLNGLVLVGFILLIRFFSGMVHGQLSRLIESKGRWKLHQTLLVLFGITVIGDRFGLSAAKTAFFLGLFMSTTTHQGVKFEDELKPIAHNVFIPIFFISLGSKILLTHLLSYLLPLGIIITIVLLAIRYGIFAQFGKFGTPRHYFFVLCPNLTMVAVAAGILIEHGTERNIIDLLLITGLLLTVGSAILFSASPTKQAKLSKEINLN